MLQLQISEGIALFLTTIISAATMIIVVMSMAIVTLLLAYLITSWRQSAQFSRAVKEMEELLASTKHLRDNDQSLTPNSHDAVPPLRIRLEPIDLSTTSITPLQHRIHTWLREHSFRKVQDFYVIEIEGELLQVYLSDDRRLVAAMRYQADRLEPYVEFCFDLGNNARGGISNPPGAPVPPPPEAVGKYHCGELSDNFGLLSQMWLEAKELMDHHETVPVSPAALARFFEDAHAAQMDSRIACGGITEEEIWAAFAAQGINGSLDDVEAIRQQWQAAIEQHLLDFSARGKQQVRRGREVLVVHDGSTGIYLHNRLYAILKQITGPEQQQQREMGDELKLLLRKFTPREAVARFRPLLPFNLRFSLVDQLKQPVEADLYAFPETHST